MIRINLKTLLVIGTVLLAVSAFSCKKPSEPITDNFETDIELNTEEIRDEEENIEMVITKKAAGADESVIAQVPDYNASGAAALTSGEFTALLIEKDGIYTAQPGVYRLTDSGITFGESFGGTSVNLTGAILLADGFDSVITISADNFKLTGLTISAPGSQSGIVCSGKNVIIDSCAINGSMSSAILISGGERVSISNCRIACTGSALTDQSDGHIKFENNIVSGCEKTALMIGSSYCAVMYNTINDAPVSVSVSDESGNIINNLIAKNKAGGKIELAGSDNSVILDNMLQTVSAASCSDLTVAGNSLSESIDLDTVQCALITENAYTDGMIAVNQQNSENIYGGNIPDKLAGTEYTGADESLLPVVSQNRFDNMAAQDSIVYNGKTITVDYYINMLIDKGGEIIIPPGKYSLSSPLFIDNGKNLGIYAYGVLFVYKDSTKSAVVMSKSHGVMIKGLTIDFAVVPNAQGTVISADGSKIVWKSDEGYHFDLTDPTRFAPSAAGEGFRQGSRIPFCDLYNINMNTVKNDDGTFTLESPAAFFPGDKITFRGVFAHVTYAEGCGNVMMEDVTIWGGSGFGFCEVYGEGNTRLNRVLMTPGPKPEGAAEERMLSVCDATHCTNMRKGIQVTNCKFEYMTDDGTNVNGTYGIITGYDKETDTVTYNADTMPEILAGDRLWIMTLEGSFLLDTEAVSVGKNGKVVIAGDFEMPNESVFLENVSANGAGFLFENTLVRGNRSRGLVIKSTDGIITHCTIDATGMTGIMLKPEISDNWGECGFTENVVVSYNNVIGTGFFDSGSDAQSAIAVRTDLAALDESYFSHRNITIIGNKIDGYFGAYAVCLRGVSDVTVKNNIIGARNADINANYPEDAKSPIYLSGCADVEISDNIFTGNPASKIRTNGKIIGISGSDTE
ncbi:MAG: right-handed parallel beta-helix repeat-containing protein [Eubacteriales bacterium]